MSDPYIKQAKLMERLFQLTQSKRLDWQVDPFDDEVSCLFSTHKIVINDRRDSDGSPYVHVSIKNLSGSDVDSFTDNDLSEATPAIPGVDSYWKLMNELLRMARRQSKGADEAIDNILGELDDKEVPF